MDAHHLCIRTLYSIVTYIWRINTLKNLDIEKSSETKACLIKREEGKEKKNANVKNEDVKTDRQNVRIEIDFARLKAKLILKLILKVKTKL